MRKITATIMTLLVAGLVVGCSESPQVVPQEAASGPQSAEQSPESTPAPLVAEPGPEPILTTAEGEYVTVLRAAFDRDGTQIPNATDEQLIAAGQDACEQIDAGTNPDSVRVVEGEEEPHADSGRIGYAAAEYLCP